MRDDETPDINPHHSEAISELLGMHDALGSIKNELTRLRDAAPEGMPLREGLELMLEHHTAAKYHAEKADKFQKSTNSQKSQGL